MQKDQGAQFCREHFGDNTQGGVYALRVHVHVCVHVVLARGCACVYVCQVLMGLCLCCVCPFSTGLYLHVRFVLTHVCARVLA